jgi:hypothetical protein
VGGNKAAIQAILADGVLILAQAGDATLLPFLNTLTIIMIILPFMYFFYFRGSSSNRALSFWLKNEQIFN